MYRMLLVLILTLSLISLPVSAEPDETEDIREEKSVIIEVTGDPREHRDYLNAHFPAVNVVETYDTLFNGLALKASPKRLEQLTPLEFVKTVHPVVDYEKEVEEAPETENNVMPGHLNNTKYTGDGVQVAVVDTGIDYEHPDLEDNFAGGYDLVDLDDDPMETKASEGMPTQHGTHVSGIIAADGEVTGVAPDADIYAYRALGPGGMGTSVQVIAALEQAVKDGADVINLSLGNAVNGPDFPTSVAVNRAFDKGVPVVTANGNDGPETWTVGSPAAAADAFSVGASAPPEKVPFLVSQLKDKSIPLIELPGSTSWDLNRRFDLAIFGKGNIQGKIALVTPGNSPLMDKVQEAEESGAVAAVIVQPETADGEAAPLEAGNQIQIPVAMIEEGDGKWLQNAFSETNHLYLDTAYHTTEQSIAEFSSRGPVTVDWDLKPEVSAPGTNVLSTVPGGYRELQGTSMAAPHVTGAMALLIEAHPDWTPEDLMGALVTTAKPIRRGKGDPVQPISQGAGRIRPNKAINASAVMKESLLTFGNISRLEETKEESITIQNRSDTEQRYTFSIPEQEKGLRWDLPLSFTLDAGEERDVPVSASIRSDQLDAGVHQGWLTLEEGDKTYQLPYMFVNKTGDYPKAMGFDLTLKPFTRRTYQYQLYVTDPAESIDVSLYHPETLIYERKLLSLDDVEVGLNKGQLDQDELGKSGRYLAVINVQLENGDVESYEMELFIDEEMTK